MVNSARGHWDDVYASKAVTDVSWFEASPETSLRLIEQACSVRPLTELSLVDIGAGASSLADRLLDQGCHDLTLLDVSNEALAVVRARLQDRSGVTYVASDLLAWQPERTFDIWHDRAVFHFLIHEADLQRYVTTAAAALPRGAALVLGTFASDGPTHCSGLPTSRYDADRLADRFQPHFVEEHREREEHHTPAGSIQPFTWLLLRRR